MTGRLVDLCAEDKLKVAQVLKKVGQLGKRLQDLEQERSREAQEGAQKEAFLRKSAKKAARENMRLRAQLDSHMQLLRQFQHQVELAELRRPEFEEQAVPCSHRAASEPMPELHDLLPASNNEWQRNRGTTLETMAAIEEDRLAQLLQAHAADLPLPEGSAVDGGGARQQRRRKKRSGLLDLCLEAETLQQQAAEEAHCAAPFQADGLASVYDDLEELLSIIFETCSQ